MMFPLSNKFRRNTLIDAFDELRFFGLTSTGSTPFQLSTIRKVLMPKQIVNIGDGFCTQCKNISMFCVPPHVTYINNYLVTQMIYSPRCLVMLPVTPPSLSGYAISSEWNYIFVPTSSIDTYKSATGWSTYASKIYPIDGVLYESNVGDYFDDYRFFCEK